MSLLGMTGGIIGTIASLIAIYYMLVYLSVSQAATNLFVSYILQLTFIYLALTAPTWSLFYYYAAMAYSCDVFMVNYYFSVAEPVWSTFRIVSVVAGVFLFLHVFLVGFGFYDIYKITNRASGIVTFIMNFICSAIILILLILAGFLPVELVPYFFTFPIRIIGPNDVAVFFAFVSLFVFLIVSGATGIAVRSDATPTSPSLTLAAGIISIIAGVLLILTIIGLLLMFVASILWIIVFYKTSQEYVAPQPTVPPSVPPSVPP